MRLSPVLCAVDLSPVELQAARLDGELYDLAGAYCLIGELETPAHRARAVLRGRSPRLIAELETAAWIWGAAPEPLRLEFAVTPEARARLAPAHHITVREIVYDDGDVVDLDGAQVTSPLRTVLDLARFMQPFDPAIVTRLAATSDIPLERCLADLDRRSGVPAKKQARRRLLGAGGYAVDTR